MNKQKEKAMTHDRPTTKQIEALKLALEAMEMWCPMTATYLNTRDEAITAIREALTEQCVCGEPDTPGTHRTDGPCLAEQPAQQEPFGYFKPEPFGWTDCAETDEGAVALYERPPASKPWVGLADDEIEDIFNESAGYGRDDFRAFARAIEAKLKERNV